MRNSSSVISRKPKRKKKLDFVQDFLPIKDIHYGVIETTGGRYIKILEIEPINFMLRSSEEQFGIISSFASWLKISPVRLQFKSITRKADSDKHVSMVEKELETEENEKCKQLGEGYIRLIKDVGSREALTRRFFLIFQYEELRRTDSDDLGKIYAALQTAEQTAKAYFSQCGNSIVQPKDPDEATAEILYMFFNRRSCVDEPFETRVNRVVIDTMQLFALRMRMRGIQCFILAPIKGHEFRRACNHIGGQYIKIAPGSPHCINIMEIRHTISPAMELIDEIDYQEMVSMLASKIQQLMIFFSLLIPDMTNEEEQMLDEALIKTYADFGITHDNDSLYIDRDANPPVMKKMPILGDLHKNLQKNKMTERIAVIVSRFVTGSAQSFNQQTNVDL